MQRRTFAGAAGLAWLATTLPQKSWGQGTAHAAPSASPAPAGERQAFALRLREVEAASGGRLGVAILDTGTGRRFGHRANARFPMCSTFKLLAAGYVLHRVDRAEESLERRIRYARADLVSHSPATAPHADGEGMRMGELCEVTITLSDNTAANLMLQSFGGPARLTAFVRGLGDPVTRLDRMETALNEALPGDPRDTTSPEAMLTSMQALVLGQALSPASREQLRGWLLANKTGDTRLRARLPAGWQVGDKTGAGARGTNNDVGILWPPGGRPPILVAAYLTESKASAALRDEALARVGELAASLVAA